MTTAHHMTEKEIEHAGQDREVKGIKCHHSKHYLRRLTRWHSSRSCWCFLLESGSAWDSRYWPRRYIITSTINYPHPGSSGFACLRRRSDVGGGGRGHLPPPWNSKGARCTLTRPPLFIFLRQHFCTFLLQFLNASLIVREEKKVYGYIHECVARLV